MKQNDVGKRGEDIATSYLLNRGHKLIDRNYLKKWGEIDIITKKDGVIHFVEVKTVARETLRFVNHETGNYFRPEDNVHPWKVRRLKRAMQSYLIESKLSIESEWQFDLITIYLEKGSDRFDLYFMDDLII